MVQMERSECGGAQGGQAKQFAGYCPGDGMLVRARDLSVFTDSGLLSFVP